MPDEEQLLFQQKILTVFEPKTSWIPRLLFHLQTHEKQSELKTLSKFVLIVGESKAIENEVERNNVSCCLGMKQKVILLSGFVLLVRLERDVISLLEMSSVSLLEAKSNEF